MRSVADVSAPWSGSVRSPRRGLLTTTLVVIAVVWTVALLAFSLGEGLLGWDVRFAYLPAAEAFLAGDSAYPATDDPILEDQKGYVYPPQLLVALLPLAVIPTAVVAALSSLAMLGMVALILWILGIRDVRCYATAFLWMPVASGVLLANVSIPLALALALAWRYRDSVSASAASLGLAVSSKLLLWPLLVWTAARGRLRTALWAVGVGAAVTLVAWAAIGFDGLTSYPALLRRLDEIQSENSYSFVGIASMLGLGETVGRVVAAVVGLALLTACVVLARRGEDLRSLTCAVGATLALSPVVWLHYLVLLLVPLAVARPRFSFLWILPIFLWVSPKPGYAEGVQTLAPAVVAAIVLVLLLRERRAPDAEPAAA